jgi:hypothetical protein
LYRKKILIFSNHLLSLLSVNTLAKVISLFIEGSIGPRYCIVNVADTQPVEFSYLLSLAEEMSIHGKAFDVPKTLLHAAYKILSKINVHSLSLRLKMLYCTRYYDLSRLKSLLSDVPSTGDELKKFGGWYASHVL